MISDEVEQLRSQDKSDQDIVDLVRSSSGIEITPEELAEHYAPPEAR